MAPVSPSAVRYIKLGAGGAWLQRCIADDVVDLGYSEVPHDLALRGDWLAIERIYQNLGRNSGKATSFRREIQDFYELDDTALWIAIGQGRLWWTFAHKAVEPVIDGSGAARRRRAIGGWKSVDAKGAPLDLNQLSTRLTKVAAYQQTICKVGAEDYLLRRINAEENPVAVAAREARAATIVAAEDLIRLLDWAEFELLTDLIFSAGGWRRISAVGGSAQADSDLILEQQITGERAFVQVTASEIEALVLERLRALQAKPDAPLSAFLSLVSRVEVLPHGVRLVLESEQLIVGGDREGQLGQFRARLDPLDELSFSARAKALCLLISVRPVFRGGRTWMVKANGDTATTASDRSLIKALVQSHEGLAEHNSAPTQGPGAWRQATAVPRSYLRQLYPAAFLAPDLQRLILEGRQPAGLTAAQLIEGGVPLAWADQRRMFGIGA